MATKDQIKAELERLYGQGMTLITSITDDVQKSHANFVPAYQDWYTAALRIVRTFAPDRVAEFRSYYDINPKRKGFTAGNYVIQDFISGMGPRKDRAGKPYFEAPNILRLRLYSQVTILASVRSRIDSILTDVENSIAAGLEDAALVTAAKLTKASPRAAGALAGVVIEDHLQRVAANRGVKIAKKSPTISDLNDPLKAGDVYDTASWRRIQYLADLRNLCAHKKDREPTTAEVSDLISGADWVVKTIL